MKIFVDANILFTATYSPQGISSSIILNGKITGLHFSTCAYAVEEARRNLESKAPQALSRLPALLKQCILEPTILHGMTPSSLPSKDHPIWLSAIHAGCNVLLTGDKKDFSGLTHSKLRVLGPAQLFKEILQ